ncbi:structural maintenance of chromosomes protein 6 [Lates japonicus]|uniref:Structural maintenance of chromosomes protein 6 n=1 Tax=Lates japonicus TaxID=270547 RepID=A0AAD3M578_LATJO|nr:structural maintenance of chromosomes protein 6 [Lates japonicus]
MQQSRPPKTAREPLRNGGSSMLESDLENHQAQLSRFQLHVTSVTEDIVTMSKLSQHHLDLKKTLVSEPHSPDVHDKLI